MWTSFAGMRGARLQDSWSTTVTKSCWGQAMCARIRIPSKTLWKAIAWSCEGETLVIVETQGCWRHQDLRTSTNESCRHRVELAQERGCVYCRQQSLEGSTPKPLSHITSFRCQTLIFRIWYLPRWIWSWFGPLTCYISLFSFCNGNIFPGPLHIENI